MAGIWLNIDMADAEKRDYQSSYPHLSTWLCFNPTTYDNNEITTWCQNQKETIGAILGVWIVRHWEKQTDQAFGSPAKPVDDVLWWSRIRRRSWVLPMFYVGNDQWVERYFSFDDTEFPPKRERVVWEGQVVINEKNCKYLSQSGEELSTSSAIVREIWLLGGKGWIFWKWCLRAGL